MQSAIDKNSKESLLSQLSRKLIGDIKTGALKAGARIPGDRALAKKYNISRGTVSEVLSILEDQRYIERIPSRGSFVADDIWERLNTIKIVFPCPEKVLTQSTLGHIDNWAAVTDAYRGLVSKAKELSAEIAFLYFEDSKDERMLSAQLKKLEEYDGAVFIGHQLGALRKAVINGNKPSVLIAHYPEVDAGCPMVIPDAARGFDELFSHIAAKAYKRIRILTPRNYSAESRIEQKLKILQEYALKNGFPFEEDEILEIDEDSPDDLKKTLKSIPFKKNREAVFFNHTDYTVPFYEFCYENGLEIGKDIGATGYAAGITFQGLVPSFTYSKINHFAIGEAACDILFRKVKNISEIPVTTKIPNNLVIGKSI